MSSVTLPRPLIRRAFLTLALTLAAASAQATIYPTYPQIGTTGNGTFPFPDQVTAPAFLWMEQGCATTPTHCDFAVSPQQLGAAQQTTTAPSAPFSMETWWNTTVSTLPQYEVYDGAQWLPAWAVDTANHVFVPPIGGGVAPTVASGTTTDICTGIPESSVTISGTASISSFGSACPPGVLKLLTFTGSATLVNNVNLIIPGLANLSVSNTDQVLVQSLGSGNFRVVFYQPGGLLSAYAPITSPHFLGVPLAPTNGNPADTSTQIANDAFVQSAIAAAVSPSPLLPGSSVNVKCDLSVPATTITCTADSVVVGASLTGSSTRLAAYSQGFNSAATGAGGMDIQPLPTSGFVCLYAIWGSGTGASILGTNCGTSSTTIYGGSNMPTGYTQSALIAALPTNSTPAMTAVSVRGRFAAIPNVTALSTASPATTWTILSIASAVPPNATKANGLISVAYSSGKASVEIDVASNSVPIGEKSAQVATASNNSEGVSGSFTDLALQTAQNLYYQVPSGTTNLTAATIVITGYSW